MREVFSFFDFLAVNEEMPTYKIRGIDVDFPYEAYDSQLVYMDKVIQSLQEVTIFNLVPHLHHSLEVIGAKFGFLYERGNSNFDLPLFWESRPFHYTQPFW